MFTNPGRVENVGILESHLLENTIDYSMPITVLFRRNSDSFQRRKTAVFVTLPGIPSFHDNFRPLLGGIIIFTTFAHQLLISETLAKVFRLLMFIVSSRSLLIFQVSRQLSYYSNPKDWWSPRAGHRSCPKKLDYGNLLTWPSIGKLLWSTFRWNHYY
jgi:hypothetical protein